MCSLPYQHFFIPPEFVTLSTEKCALRFTNYIPVVIPRPRDPDNPQMIGNCMQSLYGNFSDAFAFMFVNWMETLWLYGVSEVTVNLNNFTNNPLGERVFKYYQRHGKLKSIGCFFFLRCESSRKIIQLKLFCTIVYCIFVSVEDLSFVNNLVQESLFIFLFL